MLALGLLSFSNANAGKCGSTDTIIIPAHNWTSQIVMSHVVGELFEKIGCKVRYTFKTESQAVYEAVRIGKVTIELEIWERSFGELFNEALDKGGIIDAGTHDAVTREEWWLPNFVIEMCPGLPDWKALNKCSDMFARPGSDGKGVYVDGPVEWLHKDRRIEALDMNFVTMNVDKANDLWVELENAYKNKKAIVMFNWSPNFTDSQYGGQFVEFPAFHEKCETDKTWGINPNMTHDCGSPAGGYLKKAAWHEMPTKWPGAYKALTRINFTTNHIGDMAVYVDVDQMGHADAARSWIIDNKNVWEPWLLDLK
jgi:glycine betaine/proline transport system substrate-binding protein